MKKLLLKEIIALTAMFVFLTGCGKIKQLADIDVDLPYTTQVALPAYPVDLLGTVLPPGGVWVPAPAIGFATNSKQIMAQYNTAAEKVINVYLKSLSMDITVPANQNFDFLDTVQLYISAKSQPEMLVASQIVVPKGARSLQLKTNTEVNLKNYFVQDSIYFRIQTHISSIPSASTQLNLNSVFHMKANPLN